MAVGQGSESRTQPRVFMSAFGVTLDISHALAIRRQAASVLG